jgi:hypothetical protein
MKQQKIRYELAQDRRKYVAGATRNAAITLTGHKNKLSTGGGPMRTVALHYSNSKYW